MQTMEYYVTVKRMRKSFIDMEKSIRYIKEKRQDSEQRIEYAIIVRKRREIYINIFAYTLYAFKRL